MNIETWVESKELREQWSALRGRCPRLGQAAGAGRLGVSEAELVAAHVGFGATRLGSDWESIFSGVGRLGPLASSARNARASVEHVSRYDCVETSSGWTHLKAASGTVSIRSSRLHVAFAVDAQRGREPARALSFFDRSGRAVLRLALTSAGDLAEYEVLVDRHESANQEPSEDLPLPQVPAGVPRDAVAVDGRERIPPRSYRSVLRQAVECRLPLVVSVCNHAVELSRGGLVRSARVSDSWLVLKAPNFGARVDHLGISSAWIVRQPTSERVVTSVECCDEREQVVFSVARGATARRDLDAQWLELLEDIDRVREDARMLGLVAS